MENQYDVDPYMWMLVKGFVNKLSVDIISKASDIHGGMGIDRELPIEKYIRDVYSTLHGLGQPDLSLLRGAPSMTHD
jgi:alkylation response protein AidB-like acyl-CoA dehydrogenase